MARVLVTRPEPGATATARRLTEAGHAPVVLPLSEIGPLAPVLPPAGRVDLIAATSANALRHLVTVPSALLGMPCRTVGGRTAEAARRAGFTDVRSADGDGAALAAMIAATEPPGATVLYLCGRVRRPEFEQALGRAGMNVEAVEVYDTRFVPPWQVATALAAASHPVDAVLLYSPETARTMATALAWTETADALADASFLCLSAQVAAALGTLDDPRTYVAMEPTEDALLALLPSG
ncbi:uroporphyrinogen-III synthase [Aquibium carbonis]|uniref:Uroporphyrinogen-III synthase n=1 Tax=Aquibium carbonis TaxID=2495581 RepID=A0A3S0GC07_9HYPH|nr:uroporphyrinogen-III synthase [Aquibium carbonis]RST88370.1 uroporphyrinogen-III synthase [Aquibium carbonis]